MQRLRVLIVAALAAAAAAAAAAEETPAAAAKPAAAKPAPLAPGAQLESRPLQRLLPTPGTVDLMPRNGRPLLIVLWGPTSPLGRQEAQAVDRFVGANDLTAKMDVVAVSGYRAEKQKPEEFAEMARILGLKNMPILVDAEFELLNKLGAQTYPDLTLVGADGRILVRNMKGLDHGRLGEPQRTASQLILHVADGKPLEPITRNFPFYPASRLQGRRYPDFELPLFSPEGWGKGPKRRLSQLLSGERPGVVMFFSSTCDHCQVDVPQIVKLLKERPGSFDVVGVTRIRHANHRQVSDKYFKEQGIEFPILEDVGNVNDAWHVTSTPTTFYIAPGGTVVDVSYFQHSDLDRDWMKKHPVLMGTPPPPAAGSGDGEWKFPLKLKDEAGKVVDLSTFRGKPTLLHFWATWCVPCREELPAFVARLPELQQAGNVVIATVETDPAVVTKYRKDTGIDFPTYVAPHDGLAKSVKFDRTVPRTYLLDAQGNVEQVTIGTYDWKDPDKFANMLGRLAAR